MQQKYCDKDDCFEMCASDVNKLCALVLLFVTTLSHTLSTSISLETIVCTSYGHMTENLLVQCANLKTFDMLRLQTSLCPKDRQIEYGNVFVSGWQLPNNVSIELKKQFKHKKNSVKNKTSV